MCCCCIRLLLSGTFPVSFISEPFKMVVSVACMLRGNHAHSLSAEFTKHNFHHYINQLTARTTRNDSFQVRIENNMHKETPNYAFQIASSMYRHGSVRAVCKSGLEQPKPCRLPLPKRVSRSHASQWCPVDCKTTYTIDTGTSAHESSTYPPEVARARVRGTDTDTPQEADGGQPAALPTSWRPGGASRLWLHLALASLDEELQVCVWGVCVMRDIQIAEPNFEKHTDARAHTHTHLRHSFPGLDRLVIYYQQIGTNTWNSRDTIHTQ